jgi:hypothetical protein
MHSTAQRRKDPEQTRMAETKWNPDTEWRFWRDPMRIRNGLEGSRSGKIRKIGSGIVFPGLENKRKIGNAHKAGAWPSGVWRTSGTVSSRRITDVTVMETSAAGLSSLLMYAILRKKKKKFQYENQGWCGSGSVDPYLWLTDPDPTPIFGDIKDAKEKNVSHIFFL